MIKISYKKYIEKDNILFNKNINENEKLDLLKKRFNYITKINKPYIEKMTVDSFNSYIEYIHQNKEKQKKIHGIIYLKHHGIYRIGDYLKAYISK